MGHILLAVTLLTPPASRSLLQNTGRSSRRSAAWKDPKERTARRSRLRLYLWHQNWRVRGETVDAERGGITVKSLLGYVSIKYLPIRLCLSTHSKPSPTLSYKPCEGHMVLFTFCLKKKCFQTGSCCTLSILSKTSLTFLKNHTICKSP